MDWHRPRDKKPSPRLAVLGYWATSQAYLMVVFRLGEWWCTTGGQVKEPTWWAIPDRPPEEPERV